MFNMFKKKQDKKSDFELEDDEDDQPDSGLVQSLQLHLSRMIVYAESADPKLQREVSCSSIMAEGVVDGEILAFEKSNLYTYSLLPVIILILCYHCHIDVDRLLRVCLLVTNYLLLIHSLCSDYLAPYEIKQQS